jgi:multicomponent Na+:H+ antiporter subunit F
MFYEGIAFFLLLNMVAGLIRIMRGPTHADRMMVSQLLGTTGTAILLLTEKAIKNPFILDTALVIALLSGVAAVAFIKRVWNEQGGNS